jgi:hypothetical protein
MSDNWLTGGPTVMERNDIDHGIANPALRALSLQLEGMVRSNSRLELE